MRLRQMKMTTRAIIMMTLAAALFVGRLAAQQAADTKAADAKAAQPKYTEVKYEADMSSYKWSGENRVLALKGNVKFIQGDTTLSADKVDYTESTRTAVASGNLKIFDERNTITGEACTVNFKEKKGTLTGSVVMVAKPKPAAKATAADTTKPKSLTAQWKDEATITCDKLEFYYKEKRAVVPGPLKIVQKTRIVTADSATYSEKDDLVVLTGNVKGFDDKEKHTFSAPKVTMSLNKDSEYIEAEKATGSFFVKEDEQPAATPTSKPVP